MRFLKQLQLNKRNVKDHRVFADANKQIVLDSTNMMLVPVGTTAQRVTTPTNGHLRYNTDITDQNGQTGQFEMYQNGSWRNLRFKESTTVTQQTVGYGDAMTTVFGPLSQTPKAAQNIIVLVENVFQLATTNYTIVQNPTVGGETYAPQTTGTTAIGATQINFNTGLGSPNTVFPSVNIVGATINGSSYIQSGTTITGYHVNASGQLDYVTIDKPTVTGVIASGTNLSIVEGSRTISDNSWWLQFSSAVQYGKPVTVLFGFDQ